MKIRFYCYFPIARDGTQMSIRRNSILIDAPEYECKMFNKYLLSAMDTDFPAHHPSFADKVLNAIERLLNDEINVYTWEGDGFVHMISRDKVTFEHNIFGECPEWPIWTCTLAQYKAALQGWRQFVDMPKSIDTELIVDLPDG